MRRGNASRRFVLFGQFVVNFNHGHQLSETLVCDGNGVDTLARCAVGLARQVDGCVGLQGQDPQFELCRSLRQTPEAIEEWTAVVEIVGY